MLNKSAISVSIFAMGTLVAACASQPSSTPVSAANTTTATIASPPPAPSEDTKSASESTPSTVAAAPAATPEPGPLPTTCTPQGSRKACVPDAEYAKRLCAAEYPDVALNLFSQGTPFTRVYMTRDVDGWNATGGLTHRAKLAFDEEVLVVAHRKANANGIVMVASNGDTGSYDIVRWDGSCVSVMAEEITMSKAPKPKRATIAWRHLEEPTKSSLLSAPKVKASFDAREKACDGSKEAKCTKAEAALNSAITDFVRTNKSLPTPTHRP
ncbi:MAG TPA: hypothetical protein VNO21_13980 [Polyangiaceae bacterium]|nr:hypothetical protein [Polyangiaceae bacterium]